MLSSDTLLPAMFQHVIQQYKSKNFYNQSSHYEKITDDFNHKWKPTTKSTLFVVSKDQWNTKKGPGKFIKNALHVQQYSKRHLSG